MKKIPQKIIGNVGRCIYCGKNDEALTDEHIIPFGLNGFLLLKKASCKTCAAITSKFEQDVLRISLFEPRIGLGLPTRNKNKRPKFLELDVQKNGEKKTITLDPEDNFSCMIFPHYLQPAYIDSRKVEKGISMCGSRIVQVSGPSIDNLKKNMLLITLV